MLKKNPVSDQAIMTKVNQQLQSRGIRSPCQVGVLSLKGMVTLSGKIQYDHQRHNGGPRHAERGGGAAGG